MVAVSLIAVVVILSRQEIVLTALRILLALSLGVRMRAAVRRVLAFGVVLIGAGIMLIPTLLGAGQFGRAFSFVSEDWVSRFALIQGSAEIFAAHPLLGVGYGFFPFLNTRTVYVSGVPIPVNSPHNGVAAFLAEGGLLLALATLVVAGVIVIHFIRSWQPRGDDSELPGSLRASQACLLLLLATHLISNSLLLPPPGESGLVQLAAIYWMMMGAAVTASWRWSRPIRAL
jgi:O-antigen ligase